VTNYYVSGLRFQARNQPPEQECRGECSSNLRNYEQRDIDGANAGEGIAQRSRYRDSGICE
jgi:hypothetical protein